MIKHITLFGLILSYGFLLLIIFISIKEKLSLAKDVIISFTRMSIQLFAAGFLLYYVFKIDNYIINTVIFLFMIFFASRIVISRTKIKLKNAAFYVFISILISASIVLSITMFGIIRLHHLNARYLIPLAGMIIGNSMNSAAIGIERFFSKAKDNYELIEDLLCLGATNTEALAFIRKDALRASLLPSLTSASGMGIVFLPGMMTGQILSGINPTEAVYYQIVIVIAIAATVCLSNYIMFRFFFGVRSKFSSFR